MLVRYAVLSVVALCVLAGFGTAQSTFIPDATSGTAYSWNKAANWDSPDVPNDVPNGAGVGAAFKSPKTGSGTTQTVNLNAGITVGSIQVTNDNNAATFRLRNGTGGSLTIENPDGGTSFTVDGTSTVNNGVTVSASITLVSSLDIVVINTAPATNAAAFTGVITGDRGISKSGPGSLLLSGNNTFLGGTTLNAGTIIASTNTAFGSGTLTLNGGAIRTTTTRTFAQNIVVGGNFTLAGSGNATFSGAVDLGADDRTITTNQTSGSRTFSGVISGDAGLIKEGPGSLTLSGANTYTGGTTINAGTLTLGANNVLADAGAVTVNGGTLAVGTRTDTVGAVTVSGGSITGGTGGTLTASSYSFTNSGTVSAVLAGGAFTKSGTGTVTLTRANTFTGGATISGGTLILTGNNTYTGGTTISAGTLQLGNGETGGSVTGTIANNGALVFNRSNNLTFAGAVSGSGTLTKFGGGTLTLTGLNTYSGGTTVNAGTLLANTTGAGNSATGSGTVTVNSGGTLGGAGRVAGAVTVASGGNIRAGNASSVGTLTLGNGLTLNSGANLGIRITGTTPTVRNTLRITGGTTTISDQANFVIDGTGATFTTGTPYSFQIARAADNQSALNIMDQARFSTIGFTNAGDFLFSVTGTAGGAVQVNFTPVPEPAAVLAIAAGALGCGGLVRRRLRKVGDTTTAV